MGVWRYSTATKRRTVKLPHDEMSTLRTCHARPAASTMTRQFWRKAGFEKPHSGPQAPILSLSLSPKQTDSDNRPASRSGQGLAKYRSRGRFSLKNRRSCCNDHPSVVVTRQVYRLRESFDRHGNSPLSQSTSRRAFQMDGGPQKRPFWGKSECRKRKVALEAK
ncbi:hypothetical protein TYRP_022077, partial [Tyrophagus putrescentiae]